MSGLLAMLIVGVLAAAGAWVALDRAGRLWRSYESRLQSEARSQLDESFLFLDPGRLWAVILLTALLAAALASGFLGAWWTWPLAAGLLLVAPRLMLRHWRSRRRRLFDQQLPELVQALAAALRAGSGMQPALRHIVAHTPAPLSQELGLMLHEQRMGLSFPEALANLRGRMPSEACGLVVSALGVASQSGGSLSDTLEAIAQTLRARLHWEGRVRALTAQGRLQSAIMAALPFLMMLAMSVLEPEAMALLWSSPQGWGVLAIIALLEILGVVAIRRIMAIDI